MSSKEFIEDISESAAGLAFSLSRRRLLRAIGREVLGPGFAEYAVLQMRDVSISPGMGFITDLSANLVFGPVWSFANWLAALRAWRALRINRDLAIRIVWLTLIVKGEEVPSGVWNAFYKRNPEATIYTRPK